MRVVFANRVCLGATARAPTFSTARRIPLQSGRSGPVVLRVTRKRGARFLTRRRVSQGNQGNDLPSMQRHAQPSARIQYCLIPVFTNNYAQTKDCARSPARPETELAEEFLKNFCFYVSKSFSSSTLRFCVASNVLRHELCRLTCHHYKV